ncbi:hypothetical protein GCM10025857_68080 [Alicyclobacillus contaminans]|uniref:hemolysin XhlA family protein n=1 Tax=Alicyclobacillus contaminans TaxID=392016 RepID=UPI00054DB8DE|nr:hemolysin XhlA family protein [Alicyclobacillus contaminans]GMA50112.1 hypothetical protein GCM10025857_14690 [Alicyclobacillus contaminans]GMA52078.1 hypothetical protein GCM10025857_34350 [Alicyclobacillus contaminans]GMA55451.1 hypothetical protein GCM10025857_68080 [Alicyclobacillus contaminans]
MEQGVTIGLREIYDRLLEVGSSVQRMDERLQRLEQGAQDTEKLEEVSRTALQTAQTALEIAKETREHQTWLWRTVGGALIAGAIGALFFISKGGG